MIRRNAVQARMAVSLTIFGSASALLTHSASAFRRAVLAWKLDSSKKYCDVLARRVINDEIAMEEFPMHEKQLKLQIDNNLDTIFREQRTQKALHLKLRGRN
ncbi:hypothetical protein LXA47_03770 [Massilia sp. P8910]|uniref:hypothetical protein n=1 Tax=Massilia antarctica TaxID=2765360 RepID=UPI001E3E307E|nr:hypothetical protein [Massilia antarctica]MCE3602716.1 hypothetical protein [Massilia antarctica]